MTTEPYRQAVDARVGKAKRLLLGKGLPTESYCTIENTLRDLADAAVAGQRSAERYERLRRLGVQIGSGLSGPDDAPLTMERLDAVVDADLAAEPRHKAAVEKRRTDARA